MLPGHLEQFFEMLLAERGAAKNTIEAYRRDLGAVTEYLRPQALDTITSVGLTDYLSSIAEGGMSPRTSSRRLSALRQYFGFLVQEGIRTDNPIIICRYCLWITIYHYCFESRFFKRKTCLTAAIVKFNSLSYSIRHLFC